MKIENKYKGEHNTFDLWSMIDSATLIAQNLGKCTKTKLKNNNNIKLSTFTKMNN